MLTTDHRGVPTTLPSADVDYGKRQAIAAAEMAFSLGRKSPCLRSVPREYRAFCLEIFGGLK